MAAPKTLSEDQKADIINWYDEASKSLAKGKATISEAEKCNYVMKKFKEKFKMKPPGPVTIGKLLEKRKTSPTASGGGSKSVNSVRPALNKATSSKAQPALAKASTKAPIKVTTHSKAVTQPKMEASSPEVRAEKPSEPEVGIDEPVGAVQEPAPSPLPIKPQLTVRPPTAGPKMDDKPARPKTAKAPPPRVVRKSEMDELPFEETIEQAGDTSKVIANLITENKGVDKEEDDFVVMETKEEEPESIFHSVSGTELKGSLVKQLVDTKRELEGDAKGSERSTDEPITRLANKEVEKLRENIQVLSRLAAPLGRVLEYLQQDIDTMVGELKSWEDETDRNLEQLEKERTSTESHLLPLRNLLDQIEKDIGDEIEIISLTKANIMRNDEKIDKLLSMVVGKVN
ncbi:TRAF3-interacting protein 1 [Halotydeus destructor]|nr:TRAF3-interacting protein 1 [Halotydeus destructor]